MDLVKISAVCVYKCLYYTYTTYSIDAHPKALLLRLLDVYFEWNEYFVDSEYFASGKIFILYELIFCNTHLSDSSAQSSLVSSTSGSSSGHNSHARSNVFLALLLRSRTYPFAESLDCAGGDQLLYACV